MLAASRYYFEYDADIAGLSTGQYRYQCDIGMNPICNIHFLFCGVEYQERFDKVLVLKPRTAVTTDTQRGKLVSVTIDYINLKKILADIKKYLVYQHICTYSEFTQLLDLSSNVNKDSRASVLNHTTLPICTGCGVKLMLWQNPPFPCQYFNTSANFQWRPSGPVTALRAGFDFIRLTVHNTQQHLM